MDLYSFYRGKEFEAYEYLGAHMEGNETVFRTFAPAAKQVSVIGEFNNWKETPLTRVLDGNFWECRIENTQPGQMYKYRIYHQNGTYKDHCDPYGFWAELRPGTASRLYPLHSYPFQDTEYRKKKRNYKQEPMNIYEVQAGAWKLPNPSVPTVHYTYKELAEYLVPYLKEMNYNYVELMPITEFPSDESWGYQTTGFFSPTARYGNPDDLRFLIDACHAAEIGVILDFVAVHFAANDYALLEYDGTPIYEYPYADVGRSEWGTCNFMHARGEVQSFLQSSVWYWINEFHFDGIRVDAVSNLIYWQGNEARGENPGAIHFLQGLNAGIKDRRPNTLLIAEDSSSYAGVTKPVSEGGLGFDFKWDLGWMNDTLSYMKLYPWQRKDNYHKLTFSIWYYYNETYLLPLSHDEVVHGKATVVQKMNASELGGKFAQARILFAYMFAHPGKKLNFMGNELGGLWEWSEKKEIDWWLIRDRPQHRQFFDFIKALNAVYIENPAFWEEDYERDGFEWADCANEGKSAVYSFVRRSKEQTILAVFNFDDAEIKEYIVRLGERDVPLPAQASVPKGSVQKSTTVTSADTGTSSNTCAAHLSAAECKDPADPISSPAAGKGASRETAANTTSGTGKPSDPVKNLSGDRTAQNQAPLPEFELQREETETSTSPTRSAHLIFSTSPYPFGRETEQNANELSLKGNTLALNLPPFAALFFELQ